MRVPVLLLLALAALLPVACSTVETHRDPKADLGRFKQFYVEHRLNDDHHLDELIVAELKSLGYQASCGPLTMMPQSVEAVVFYQDAWAWDFKSYLFQLDIGIRDARKESPVASGSYRQPSMVTKTPPEVVHVILAPLLKRS